MLFGEFLVHKGVLSAEEVDRVLLLQRKIAIPLGKLALERSLLTLADIFQIRGQQRKTDSKFGDIAIKLNLLKPRQVDSLVELQKAIKPFVGELLVREGVLGEDALLALLREFKAQYGKPPSPHTRRIALVGLELSVMLNLKNNLTKLGHEVLTENFTVGDLRQMVEDAPDYIVLNLVENKKESLDKLKALRTKHPGFNPKMLALVAQLNPDDRERSIAAGIADFVPATAAAANIAQYIHSILDSTSREEAGKILLVDDSPTVLRLTSFYLEGSGYESLLASTGEEALAILEKVQPDLVLSDVLMPGMDGIELCRRIKLNPKTRNVPVLIITTSKEAGRMREALDSGASDYISKPFQQEELLARVRSHIRTKRLIDELQASRGELLTVNEKLAEANNRKTEFLSTVAHDLRTPLTSIRTYSELLSFPNVTIDTQKEFIGIIQNEALRMAGLIRNYLDISRVEAGSALYEKQAVDLRELAAYFAKIYATMAANKSIRFTSAIPDGPVMFLGDKEHFEQVISNLLDNAVKFTPANGAISLEMNITRKRARDYAEMLVRDTGPGIPADAQEVIFKKYHHLPSENQTIAGTGLGLAICKEIVEWHGGKISVESEPGHGAVFRVTLPMLEHGKEAG
ncbi:MAG: hybrid sensor histidine kinase/response regulator [Nitrospinae bacterium]|nr:hybrid sensor histidine kinase/response regulator [Nitrospinota bacterium]